MQETSTIEIRLGGVVVWKLSCGVAAQVDL